MSTAWFITKKILFWSGIGASVLIIVLLVALEIFDRYISSEKGTRWLYSATPHQNIEINRTKSGIRYLSIGDPDKPSLLLVHGAPGCVLDWVAIAKRKKVYDQYRLLIPDRPGYGGTKPRGAVVSIKEQAEWLLDVLEAEQTTATVLGHSYGAPIALAMGALDPQRVEKVYGVSGQYNPDNEIIFYVSHFIVFPIFKYILPRMVWVSNEEKMGHPNALREVQSLFHQIKVPLVLIHGDKDTLVLYENSTALKEELQDKAKLITMKGHNHPVHVQVPDKLLEIVLSE